MTFPEGKIERCFHKLSHKIQYKIPVEENPAGDTPASERLQETIPIALWEFRPFFSSTFIELLALPFSSEVPLNKLLPPAPWGKGLHLRNSSLFGTRPSLRI